MTNRTTVQIATDMGTRAGLAYVRTGVSGPTPFDRNDPNPIKAAMARAYNVAYVATFPKPQKPTDAGS